MEQILEFFLKSGLKPLSLIPETSGLEREVNRSELSALIVLSFRGEMAMSALASELGAPLSTITSLAKRLVRKGLIERKQSNDDQRVILVTLTDKGNLLAQQARSVVESVITRVQKALSPEELNQFVTLALKVGKALQQKNVESAINKERKFRNIPIE
ncbi:MarR family transcriptional regulator [Paenibacillus sp. NEAU-GSW1]|nr:MarR family transcriptional regulator [Paenibacillus sp. NEAU-GSW1]MUT67433.1 MarR family transcriptional regulator [Paenibacillus sp. NEAU-GSW1]